MIQYKTNIKTKQIKTNELAVKLKVYTNTGEPDASINKFTKWFTISLRFLEYFVICSKQKTA